MQEGEFDEGFSQESGLHASDSGTPQAEEVRRSWHSSQGSTSDVFTAVNMACDADKAVA